MLDRDTPATAGTQIDLRFDEQEIEERYNEIISFIKDHYADFGADKAVLGLSGGIDSSLVCSLCVDALGQDRVHGVILPSEANRQENMSDAEQLAQSLAIDYDIINVDPLIELLYEQYVEPPREHRAVGKLQSQLRGTIIYFVGNHLEGTVVGTGNRTELLYGYFTKFGDGAVDCHPIGHLYKQQVRQLAEYVDLDEKFISKPSTAGLWEGQTDEQEMGITYETIDSILATHIDGGLSQSTTCELLDIDEEVVKDVRRRYLNSEHKRTSPLMPPAQIHPKSTRRSSR